MSGNKISLKIQKKPLSEIELTLSTPIVTSKSKHKDKDKDKLDNKKDYLNPNRDSQKIINFMKKYVPEKYFPQVEDLESEIDKIAMNILLSEEINKLHPMFNTKYKKIYNQLVFKVTNNVTSKGACKNTYIERELELGNIKLCDMPSMSTTEINPTIWVNQIDKMKAEANQVLHGNSHIATTDQIKCPKRGCNAPVTYKEEQTRSADEAATIIATCVRCRYKFTI